MKQSIIKLPLSETAKFAELVSEFYNWGVKFEAEMIAGNWEITIIG